MILSLSTRQKVSLGRKTTAVLLLMAVAASTILIFHPAASAMWDWSMVGSRTPGSRVNSLIYVEGIMYAGCWDGKVYQNDLSGGTWTQTGSNTPGLNNQVWALAYDGNQLYAGCWDGKVYQNDLSGGAWTQVGSITPVGAITSIVYAEGKLYAGRYNNGAVYEYDFSAGTWIETGKNPPETPVWSLACVHGKLFAGCGNGTVYECDPSEGTWAQTGKNTPGSKVNTLCYGDTRLYAGCDNNVVYENDLSEGAAWTQTGSNTPGSPVYTLLFDGKRLYAGSYNGIYQNDLKAEAWTQTGSNPVPDSPVNSLAFDGAGLYAGCWNGIVYRNDRSSGAPWTQVGSSTPGTLIYSLASNGANLYAGCYNGSVCQTGLSGGTWTWTGSGNPGRPVLSLAYDGTGLYAGCSNGYVYKNDLSGGAWTQVGESIDLRGANVNALYYRSGVLYAGCTYGGVYRNNLQGGGWARTDSDSDPFPGTTVSSLACDGTRLYAGCFDGFVYRNDLAGGAWSKVGNSTPGSPVTSLAYDGTRLYAGCSNNNQGIVYRNDLAGGEWTQVGSGNFGSGSGVNSLAYDGHRLYAGCSNGFVYQNDLAGGEWTPTGSGSLGIPVFSLACGGKCLYAACINGDVYRIQTVFPVTAQVQGSGGAVTPKSQDVPRLHNATVNIIPSTDYHTASVTDNDIPVNPTPTTAYTINNVTGPHDVVVTFALNTYIVNASVSSGHGTVTPPTRTVNHGGSAAIEIKPESGYHTATVTDNGAPVNPTPATSYTIDNVTGPHDVVVTFAQVKTEGSTWYLAEGTTAWGFSTYVTIENPNPEACTAAITYNTSNGAVQAPDINLPPMSQTTVNPEAVVPNQDFSTLVTCREGKTIAVDRTMSWTGAGSPSPEGHSSVGVTAPNTTWYLPEGSSDWGFETWLLIQNPNNSEATCTVTYMTEKDGAIPVEHKVPANSRRTFNMEADVGKKDASIKVDSDVPVIPERAMYRNERREGHDSMGTTTTATDYYLAEGTTAWGFTTYVLVQNPQNTPTDVIITYMTPSGPLTTPTFSMPANSRKTVRVNDIAEVSKTDLSTMVHGSQPIIAERAMYWGAGTPLGEACHDSIGMDGPHTTFYLPDGQTSNGRETWTLVQNPNDTDVTVEVSYMTPDGSGNVVFPDTIGANSRKTFNMADGGINGRAAVMVSSRTPGKKIMVERAMYWNSRGAGTDTIGGYSD